MTSTYFLTGALGCIGAWVAKTLVERGDHAVVFDSDDRRHRLDAVIDPGHRDELSFVQGDVTDARAVAAAMQGSGAESVIHLAGLQVPSCREDPARGAAVNVVGTLNVFDAARTCGVTRVVYASSAAVFGPMPDGTVPDETAAPDPQTHYGVFKRANEGNARVYWQDHGLATVGLRPLTVYGVGRDQGLTSGPTRAMKAAVLGRPFHIGFSGATDYQFVADTAETFVACADRSPRGACLYNLQGDSVDLSRIVALIRERRATAEITFDGPEIPVPAALDGAAIHRDILGLPATPLEEGVSRTMDRFQRLLDAGRLDTTDVEQGR
ncbi:MAG: epimerase [Planctomycetes bacterium]|nr:epimerase [Planctomycetota bacterium]